MSTCGAVRHLERKRTECQRLARALHDHGYVQLTFGYIACVKAINTDEEDVLVGGFLSLDCRDGTSGQNAERTAKDGGECHCDVPKRAGMLEDCVRWFCRGGQSHWIRLTVLAFMSHLVLLLP